MWIMIVLGGGSHKEGVRPILNQINFLTGASCVNLSSFVQPVTKVHIAAQKAACRV